MINHGIETAEKRKNALSIETPEMRKSVFMRSKGKCVYCGRMGDSIVTKPTTPEIKFLDRNQLRSTDFECVCENCLKDVDKRSKTAISKKMIVWSESGMIEYR